MFVIFPNESKTDYEDIKSKNYQILNENVYNPDEKWQVAFVPKLSRLFEIEFEQLTDFSQSEEDWIKYFSGTAHYKKNIKFEAYQLEKNKCIILDLGLLNDITELIENGENATVLWHPPYKEDITPWLKTRNKKIIVSVTNN
ncbi:glycosylhydrolase-like jelly roll fold domain-containing protein [Dysgonomonas macrotermitis]|uniref:Uncharacterized protein n=1 Tax=Dysgonomonas macrotermitis TaxID=1346286 RepID=A0A1M5JJB2_9BACT|nr:glycosylhydrolase-like jelly roll fold domain-containing protein [Dysgonomonas macrotermitis]SHG40642.1 hypothetical protein SAMN05444362_1252 [Dysgonomonas macrotermitis]